MAAQSAELKLRVSLDLTTLRRQLNSINTELGGQGITLPIKFDRQSIVKEFGLLNRYISNKKFYVEINTNLKNEIDNAQKLTKAIAELKGASQGISGVSGAAGPAGLRGLILDERTSYKQLQALYKFARDAQLPFEQLAKGAASKAEDLRRVLFAGFGDIGDDVKAGISSSLRDANSVLAKHGREMGEALLGGLKADLGIASPSKETEKLGEFAAEGFEKGFIAGVVRAERTMANAIRSAVIGSIRDGLGNLPGLGGALVGFERQLAASVQLAVRRAMREGMSASIAPGAKGALLGGTGGAATGAAVGGAKALGGGIAGGVAKLTAGGLMGTAANLARYSLDSGAYQEFVGKLYQEIINSALSSGSQGAIIGALAVGGVAGGIGFARGATGSLAIQAVTAIRNRVLAALLAVSTGEMNSVVKVMVRDVTATLFTGIIRQLRSASQGLPKIDWPALAPARTAGIGPSSTGRLLPAGADPKLLEAAAPLAGLLPGISQTTARRSSIATGLEAIFAAGGPAFPEGPSGKLAMSAEMLKARIDAILQEYFKVVNVEVRDIFAAPALPSFPHDYKDLHWRVVQMLQPIVDSLETATKFAKEAGIDRKVDLFFAQISSALRLRQEQIAAGMPRPGSRTLPAQRIAGLLPPVGGTTPPGATRFNVVRTGDVVPPRQLKLPPGRPRGLEGQPFMRAPSIGDGSKIPPIVPPVGGGGAFGMGGLGDFGRAMANVNLPGKGLVQEIGQEFAFAAKQVLLYGTAYKALAFIQTFPAQVGQAVGELQSFNNTLKAISPSADEVAASNEFILSTVDKYNVPLQSARDGFTKLYASMQPAGFNGEEIRDLFSGISKAAATFGMSSDKVDRVTYAFAQMASKGQVMSEELKGQLGDVLPGAMAIFAKAAGFEGPGAIQKFSKALEDGAYKGGAMRELLKKVTTELNKEFGPGAEGAAKTFQGVMNRMANSTKLLYESFEPVAIGFLNAVVVPLTNGIKTVSDGFTAFFSGTQAQTAGGQAFAAQLTALKPAFDGIVANIKTVLPLLSQFGQIALGVGQALVQIAGNPIVGYLARVYAIVLPLTIAFNAVKGVIGGVIATVMNMNGAILLGTQRLTVFRAIMQTTGLTASQTAVGLRVAAAAFATLGGAGILLAIGALIEKMFMLKGAVDSISQAAVAMRANISGMANAGMVGGLKNVSKDLGNQLNTYKSLKGLTGGGFAGGPKRLPSEQEAQKLREVGLGGFVGKDVMGRSYIKDFVNASKVIDARISQIQTNIQDVQKKLPLAQKIAQNITQQTKPSASTATTPVPTDEDGKGKGRGGADKAAKAAERLTEQIAQQAQAAADALFNEQQRLAVMQATDPTAKAFAEYASQELVIQRELNQKLKEAKSEKERQLLVDTAASQQKQNALKLDQELARAREQAMQPLEDALRNQREQLLVEADIKRLVAEGMVPERAKEVAEIRRLTRAALEQIDAQIAMLDKQIEVAKAALLERQAREGSTKAVQDMIKALDELEKRRKKAEEDKGKASSTGAAAEAGVPAVEEEKKKSPMDFIKESASNAQKELEKLSNWGYQVAEGAKSIGSAFGQAFKDIASGSKTTQEALSSMFQSIADHFLEMAAQIITQMLVMYALKLILGIFGGGGGGLGSLGGGGGFGDFSGGSFSAGTMELPGLGGAGALAAPAPPFSYAGVKFADGGFVTGPTQALIGEGGESEYVIPASKMRSAMNRYASGARGSAVIPGNGESDGGPTSGLAAMNASSIDVRYTVERINSVDYVTADQFRAGMAQAAQQGATQGEQRTLRRLQQSRATRSRLGMN